MLSASSLLLSGTHTYVISAITSGRLGTHTRCLGHFPSGSIVSGKTKHENLPTAADDRTAKQKVGLLRLS